MATYSTIKRGSSDKTAIKTWQNYLKSQGYDIGKSGVDGIFGSATDAATRQYQKDKGLTVDGIVGANTWGSMNTSTKNTTNKTATTKAKAPSFTYEEFKYTDPKDSDSVKQAEAKLQELMTNKPGEFQYSNQGALDEVINKIMNGEKFSYDLNGDALWQQYKDQYVNQGKLAMQDAIGQASAMTGGYGNSYAQSVGQQTYQGYLQQLNDKIPELYQLALNKFNMEQQNLKDQYGMLLDDRSYEHGLYRDSVDDYYTDLQYLTGERDTAYNMEMDAINTALSLWADKQEYAYKTYRDSISDADTAKKYAYDTAMAMLSMGVTPSAQMLEDAGISSADASEIVKKVAANEAKAKGGTSGSGASGDVGSFGNVIGDTLGSVLSGANPTSGTPINDTPEVDDEGEEKSTYSYGYDYLISQGLSAGAAAGLMTQGEWVRRKAQGNTSAYGSSYEDYVELYCQKNKGK